MSIVEVDNVEDERLEDNLPESSLSGYPTYIQKLLSPNTPLDFHITVGDPNKSIPEKIGVLKWMLITRSKVLSVMLFESKMKETGDFSITDLDPHTFKNFLVFVYGHDNTSTISFEEAVKMLNVAEKYDVQDLKDKLAKRIQLQVTVENIFIILQNPEACEQAKSLWQTVTEIIQYNTEGIFSNEEFVNISEEAMIHILQQDSLSVPEIELWRASLKWASHKAKPEQEGEVVSADNLRSTILPLLKYLRLCTLSPDQLLMEVLPTNILTNEEFTIVCKICSGHVVTETLQQGVCGEVQKRCKMVLFSDKNIKEFTSTFYIHSKPTLDNNIDFWILTRDKVLQLCAIECRAKNIESTWKGTPDWQALTYRTCCTITISQITDHITNTSSKPDVKITFDDKVKYENNFTIPLKVNHSFVSLEANSKYKVKISFDSPHPVATLNVEDGSTATDCFDLIYRFTGGNCFFSSNLSLVVNFTKLFYKAIG